MLRFYPYKRVILVLRREVCWSSQRLWPAFCCLFCVCCMWYVIRRVH